MLPCCAEEQQLHSSEAGPEYGLHYPIEDVPELCMPLNDYTFCLTTFVFCWNAIKYDDGMIDRYRHLFKIYKKRKGYSILGSCAGIFRFVPSLLELGPIQPLIHLIPGTGYRSRLYTSILCRDYTFILCRDYQWTYLPVRLSAIIVHCMFATEPISAAKMIEHS
jgi:hypothetical protein